MTNERVSYERLAEMLADAISERDRPIIGDGSLYDFHPGELVNALTELQSLRSAREAEPVTEQVARSAQWHAFSSVLEYINTLEDKVVAKKSVYSAVMEMRPAPFADIRADLADLETMARHLREVTAAYEELLARPSPSTEGLGVRVKGLEWGERKSNGDIYADSVVGEYGVGDVHGKHTVMLRVGEQDSRVAQASGFDDAKAAAQADYERRILSALDLSPADTQCCMCGKTGLSTIEGDGGTECQLEDGRWTCSEPCWEKAGGYGPDLSPEEGEALAAEVYIRDWCPDHVKDYVASLAAPSNPVISDGIAWQHLQSLTFAVQHSPNCPSPYLVRLPGASGLIDMKSYGDPLGLKPSQTGDVLGFGKTLEQAAAAALSVKPQSGENG